VERALDQLRVIGFGTPPALAAALEGGFAREGIDVDLTRTPSSERQIRGLLAGEWDVAHTAVDNVFEYVDAEGADLVLVLVGEIGTDVRLVARDAADIASLAGKRMGVDSPRSGYALLGYLILARNGVARGGYDVLQVGGSTERARALTQGRVDFAMLGSPHAEEAAGAGCRVLADAAAYAPGYPALSVAVRRTWAAAHRDVLIRYCRALLAAIRSTAPSGPPPVAEMRASVGRALALRREVLGDGPLEVGRYIDLAYAEAAAR
jgi:ABC-type nitrate/sulfonate/bicarbonate transport system substrate-binding protein